jgi:hypothetical protein
MANMLDFLLEELKSKGRNGDTELAHVNPTEKMILKLLGGAGTINPETGLREYNYPAANRAEQLGLIPEDPYGTGMSLDAPGEEISQDKFREFIDPNTNTIKDPTGLVAWLKSVNPQLLEKDDSGNYIWSDEEIINWVVKRGPSMFADPTDIAMKTQQFKLGAGKSRQKAGQATVKDLTTGGVGGMERFGQYGFGGRNVKMAEALYKDIGTQQSQYEEDIFALQEDATTEFGDFIYGMTDPDSPYSGL